jgi:uncharacterized membrane protein YdjX (TVP38/TMEM64 family)
MAATRVIRVIAFVVLICLIGIGIGLLFFTNRGNQILHDPRDVGRHLHGWLHHHWIVTPVALVLLYVVLTLLALPVWWLQMLGGYAAGFLWGMIFCQIAATLSAVLTVQFSRWLAAEWFHQTIESKVQRLRRLDEQLGHNGFLVVMAVRLTHVLPFSLSNYALGLTRISVVDVAVGTLLGGIPSVAIYVALGAAPHLLRGWRFWTILGAINLILIIPILLRYLRPAWFERIGLE